MGLDLYLRKVTKPQLDRGRAYTRLELNNKGIDTIEFPKKGEKDSICRTIRDNSVPIVVIDMRYVKDKLAEAAGLDAKKVKYLSRVMESFGEISKITFELLDENEVSLGEITINSDDENYLEEFRRTMLAYELKEVAYQRKGLNDYGWELLPPNCSDTDDFKVVEALVQYGGLSEEFIDKWEEGRTIFHPWW